MPDTPPSNNEYDDDGSLFGSPPPSPSRGRSPSPLAFPSGTAQNVGTLALPGSHLVAELPVNPPASSSLSVSATAPSRPSVSYPPLPPRLPLQTIGVSSLRNSSGSARIPRPEGTTRKPRKRKERENSSTPRPTPPPIPLPSPDEPPPLNFLRNQQALLGVAGMVGGVNPANLAKTHQTRGMTAENPIVVEDEPTLSQQPSIGKRPRPGPSDASQLPRPTSEQILGTLLQQKNIFPVVISLLRFLVPSAPSLVSVSPNYPVYAYPYAATAAFQTPTPSSAFRSSTQTRSQSPQHSPDSRQSPSFSAPPLKRRKLNSVPAGAGDWDVPYPFPDGHGPDNYRTNWERERGKRLLADLVQLVQGAAQKAATKAWYQQQAQQRMFLQAFGRGGSGNWYGQSGSMKYYRPATFSYGLERPNAQHHASQMHQQTCIAPNPGSPPFIAASMETATPEGTPAPASLGYVQPVAQAVTQINPNASTPLPDLSSIAFDQLVESLLAAQQHQQPLSSSDNTTSSMSDPVTDLDSSSQALFDNWLEILTAFPPGDPNDVSGSGAASSPTPATSTPASTAPNGSSSVPLQDDNAFSPIPDTMIDPALLDLAASVLTRTASQSEASPYVSVHTDPGTNAAEPSSTTSSPTSTAVSRQPPVHTPSLVGSPSVTATSLTDAGDAGPATPSWDWTFADLGDAESAKLLDEWAGMDLDVVMASWGGGDGTAAVSVLETAPPTTVASASPPPAEGDTARQTEALAAEQEEDTPHFGSLPDPVASEITRLGGDPPLLSDAGRPASDMALTPGLPSGPAAPSTTSSSSSFSFTPPQQPPSYPPVFPPPATQEMLWRPAPAPVPANPSARAKGKAKAIPGTGNGVASRGLGKQDRQAVVERARVMRQGLVAEIERAKVALWETTLEQGVLVGLGRELEKGKQKENGAGSGSGSG